ncbi:FAD-binding domain [Haliangium sp.]|uniref:FAD-binding domain n=1 Tax=Haliangium sp. TaxID=2663208 RepID=UPI003D1321EB
MKIAINGTGVAGPTLAYWLRHFGHEPVLFEKAPALRTGGYVIDFWGLGYDIADKMGLVPELHAKGYQMEQLVAVDDDGSTRARMDMGNTRELLGDRFVSIPRGDLAATLFGACDGIETRFGVSVEHIEQRSEHVRVTLSDDCVERFDLVVGADGLHSRVRDLAFGPEARCSRDLGTCVAAFQIPGYRPRDELVYVSHTVPGRQIGRIALRDDMTVVLMVFDAERLAEFPTSTEAIKAALREVFSDMRWETPQILAHMDEVDEVYFDRVSQIHLDAWTRGRVALIGDAAACASLLAGEGSGLAMTEAYVLAGELHRSGGAYEVAFQAYETRLRAFLGRKQRSALRNTRYFVPRSRLSLWVRDRLVQLANRRFFAKRFVAGALSDDVSLPDYDRAEA